MAVEGAALGVGLARRPGVADWPIMIMKAKAADRWFGMTWYADTLSLIGNKHHPCLHADPRFPDLDPGQRFDIRGRLLFFEGNLEDFTVIIRADNPEIFK